MSLNGLPVLNKILSNFKKKKTGTGIFKILVVLLVFLAVIATISKKDRDECCRYSIICHNQNKLALPLWQGSWSFL